MVEVSMTANIPSGCSRQGPLVRVRFLPTTMLQRWPKAATSERLLNRHGRRLLLRSLTGSASGRPTDYDVVIVGGGPAGLALASALGWSQFGRITLEKTKAEVPVLPASSKPIKDSTSIALIEAGDLSRIRQWSQPEGTFSNRVSSITNASQSFLEGNCDNVEQQFSSTNPSHW